MIEPDIEPLVTPEAVVVVSEPQEGWLKCEALVPYHGMYRNCRKDAEMHRGGRIVCATHGYAHEAKFRPEENQ